jgi:molybdopterin converting factor subunit 1
MLIVVDRRTEGVWIIKVRVKMFASFRDIIGTKEEELEIPEGTTVQKLLDSYIERFPDMARYRDHIILSVNKEYGAAGLELKDGDEVSFLPPVSGG